MRKDPRDGQLWISMHGNLKVNRQESGDQEDGEYLRRRGGLQENIERDHSVEEATSSIRS